MSYIRNKIQDHIWISSKYNNKKIDKSLNNQKENNTKIKTEASTRCGRKVMSFFLDNVFISFKH